MKAGRELDELIAEDVMGFKLCRGLSVCAYLDGSTETSFKIFTPSSNMADAWLVVEKLDKDRKFLYVSNVASGWECNIEADRWYAIAETAPLAICLAALKACGVDID